MPNKTMRGLFCGGCTNAVDQGIVSNFIKRGHYMRPPGAKIVLLGRGVVQAVGATILALQHPIFFLRNAWASLFQSRDEHEYSNL